MMLRAALRLLLAVLAISLAAPVTQAAARPAPRPVPTMPDCAMMDGCCDSGAACVANCDARCVATVPVAAALPLRPRPSSPVMPRVTIAVPRHSAVPEPPVPRLA